MEEERNRISGGLAVGLIAAAVLLVVVGVVLALHPLVYAFGAVAAIAVAGWLRDRGRLAGQVDRARDADRRAAEAEQRSENHDARLAAEQRLRERVEQARRTEHDWNRELREEIVRLHREGGPLGHTGDVRELVLEIAIRLVEAEKGLLLSREDGNDDGRLDLVCDRGFADPDAARRVAERFADKVIDRDTTVREDDSGSIPADEIKNLVAVPIYISDDFSGVVVCANRDGGFENLDDDVLLSLGDHAGMVLENGRLHGELRSTYVTTVGMLADALEAKDPFLRTHSDEVSAYVAAVVDRLEIEGRRREEIIFASLLHDVGKIGISERILLKPGRLTPEERTVIELHPRIGYRLVDQVPALRSMTPGILHHHERWDGDGYPSGLRGEEIPLEGRVICVADCFSAMTSDRPYRAGMSVEDACAELERCAGTQFDPKVVRFFVEEVRRRPPQPSSRRSLAEAMDDPEITTRRDGDEPLLGHGPIGLTDNLTLLYSRRYLHEIVAAETERAMVQGAPFSILLAELDIARENREAGYAAGDAAIRSAAAVLRDAADRCGGIACRFSGRRLALLVPGGSPESAEALAGRVAAGLAERGHSARLGVAGWEQGAAGDEVISAARADLAANAAAAQA
jgi:diguanylate cyclase (GGDEF)-like protein